MTIPHSTFESYGLEYGGEVRIGYLTAITTVGLFSPPHFRFLGVDSIKRYSWMSPLLSSDIERKRRED